MQPMPPKIRKTRLPKRKASNNAVPRGLRSPRTCFFAPVSPHRSHAVVLHGYRAFRVVFSHCRAGFPLRSRCFLTLPCRFPTPSRTPVPMCRHARFSRIVRVYFRAVRPVIPHHSVPVFSHRHALILRTVRARFLAPFPRGRSALVFGRRTFGLCSLGAPSCTATRALLARFTPVTRLFHRLCCIKTEARRLFPRICFRGAYGASVFRYEKFRFPVCRLAQCHEKPLDT